MDGPEPIKNDLDAARLGDVKGFTDAEYEECRITSEAIRKFQAACQGGKITFNWNGHHKRRVTKPTFPSSYANSFRSQFGVEEDIGEGWKSIKKENATQVLALLEKPGDESVPFGECTYTMGCYGCGQDIPLTFNGDTVKAGTRCKFPDGMGPINVTISVPSGKLVFVNYFDGVDVPNSKDVGLGPAGLRDETRHYAKHNIAYAACGNSCPSVWLNAKKDKIIVGNVIYDEKDDKKVIDGFEGYTRVGGVCTDLWAWSAACIDTATSFGWEQSYYSGGKKAPKDDIVKVIPGKYRVSQMFHMCDYDNYKAKHKFATIERIGR
jgi:hypothetical protein